jgi:leader peptidase (prepilin peptidase) / N-methyltransferase
VLALVLGRFSAQPKTLVFAFIGAFGVALATLDVKVQRLPDRLTLPAFPVLIALPDRPGVLKQWKPQCPSA